MPSSIIHGRYLITKALGHDTQVVNQGAVFQRDGVIVEVGPLEDVRSRHQNEPVWGGDEYLVMPGLVNAHHHGKGVTPLQKGSLDDQLEYWMVDSWGRKPVDTYLDTLYACMKLLRSGVTTVMFNLTPGPADHIKEDCEKALKAFAETGQRTAFSVYIESQYRVVAEDEATFLGRLPSDLAARVKDVLDDELIGDDDYIALCKSLHRDHHNDSSVSVFLSPANAHWCSDSLLTKMRSAASDLPTGLHIHLVESVYEKLAGLRLYGKTALAHLDDLGFLGPDVSLAHAVWLTDEDIELAKDRGVVVCTNPSSNLRLRTGIAPVAAMVSRGLEVALGTDSTSINEDEDMLQEMRLAHRLHRAPGVNTPYLTTHQVMKMATVSGAKATMFDDVGSLEPGKRADFVLIRLENVTEPYLDPEASIIDGLVYRAKGSDVDTVIIDGQVVFENGRFTNIDEQSVLAQIKEELSRPLSPQDQALRQTVRELMPYLYRFYETWDLGQTKPFYVYNSSI